MRARRRIIETAAAALTATLVFSAQLDFTQRPDGCPSSSGTSSEKDVARALKTRGLAVSHESLLGLLGDPSPDVRGLAAQALVITTLTARDPDRILIFHRLGKSWLKEKDACVRALMDSSLMKVGTQILLAGMARRGGSYYPAPFTPCTPSTPKLLSLSVANEEDSPSRAAWVRVSLRNSSPEPIVFYKYRSPSETFSPTVLDASNRQVPIPEKRRFLYMSAAKRAKLNDLQVHGTNLPFPLALQPDEQTSWDWDVSEEFDLSTPGTYRVSLGGPIHYLNTEVCSGEAEITIH